MPEKEKARKDDMLAFSFPFFLIDAQLELESGKPSVRAFRLL